MTQLKQETTVLALYQAIGLGSVIPNTWIISRYLHEAHADKLSHFHKQSFVMVTY